MHYTSPAPAMTKYDMTRVIAESLGLPIKHVIADTNKPQTKPGQTERPENTQLSTRSLQDVGIDVGEEKAFAEWWAEWAKVVPRKQ
jgi:S-adenosylmethionine synthetase